MSVTFDLLPCRQPTSTAELGKLVRDCATEGQPIYPGGGRTMLGVGMTPTKPGIAIDLRRLNQVIDYPARDMTITVQAGITIAKLQEVLRAEKQRLPIDMPLADRATLGGAVACNVSGPRRYGYGTLRDYVIGISVVNDRGEEAKAGGRVVKNVAGYDLCKLHIGALGTLGIVTQLTLKVRPSPEACAVVAVRCSAEELSAWLDRIHQSQTRPVAVELVSAAAAKDLFTDLADANHWLMLVGFEDSGDAVAWQVQQLRQELGCEYSAEWTGDATDAIWTRIVNYPWTAPAAVSFKANLPPHFAADLCRYAAPLTERITAHSGNGIVWGLVPERIELETARETIDQLRKRAGSVGGKVQLPRCRNEWKPTLGVWDRAGNDLELMHSVKRQLDPRCLFNPGRFVVGI
jgi:glycolate oxidase FAD binding subunit